MPEENTFIRHFFAHDGELDPEEKFDLNRKSRSRRMREMWRIMRKHHFMRGFTPVEFRGILEELGPSFVKVGQVLSTRSEILPKAYCDELAKLRTECDPLPFDLILKQLHTIYGDRYDSIFAEVDPTPLGSASLAQVHKARLVNGDIVAVKVQRPGVKRTMAQDIDIMRVMVNRFSRFMKDDQMLDLHDVVEEMWSTFLEETDFAREAENLDTFAYLNAKCKFIACPKVYHELCGEYVLVMEYVEGIPIYKHQELVDAGYDLQEIGEKILDNYATQILDHGFFHADPHPGNIIIRGGKIVYIDLGIMGRLNPSERAGFGSIINAVGEGNSSALKDALLSFAVQKDNSVIDHPRFLADLDLLLKSYGSCDVADLDIGLFLNDIFALTRSSKCVLPSSITNVSRGIVAIEGTIIDFIPNDNMVNIINAHIQRNQHVEDRVKDSLEDTIIAIKKASEGLAEAAQYSGETLRMITRGQVKVNMDVLGSEAPMNRLSTIVNRMTMGLIIAGLFIGSSMLAPYTAGVSFFGLPAIPFFGFLGALVLSIWVVVNIGRKG